MKMKRASALCLVLSVLLVTTMPRDFWLRSSAAQEESLTVESVPPTEPSDAPATFRTVDGFRMVPLAVEPLVYDPVALIYDENGRGYVAEMRDYPYTNRGTAQSWEEQTNQDPIGRIRLLEDEDGDGAFDRSHVFADRISWPTGLALWKGGLFVAATPDIWYLKDTDNDGKADIRQKVYTGFRKYNIQAVINNLIWGLDHHIYGAGGTNGGTIRRLDGQRKSSAVQLSRNDFRFDPVTGAFEALSGGARFGNTFDDWGNRFICNIRNPLIHVVLPSRYLVRNPYLPVASPIHDAAESGDQLPVYPISPPEAWRVIRAARRASDPTQRMPRSELVGAGYWTSSAGVTVYRGAAYPERYHGNVFVGEVAGNLIHRQILKRDGVTFHSARADQKREFVASTDNWFRPVNFTNAPDGTLHVVDMSREIIEHPWSIPDDIHAELDLRSGRNRGRIYRLEPPGFEPPTERPRLGEATTADLVATLENPNSWWRETAHRLLYERQDASAVPLLRRLLKESRESLARLHALWSLEGLNALQDADVIQALGDGVAGVREHAVRLAEPRLKSSPELLDRVLQLADDESKRVRFQVAFTLGEVNDSRASDALLHIARQDADDSWMRTAVLSSVGKSSHVFLARLLKDEKLSSSHAGLAVLRQLATVVGARRDAGAMKTLLATLDRTEALPLAAEMTVAVGLGEGLLQAGGSLRDAGTSSGHDAWLDRVLTRALDTASDREGSTEERKLATELLAFVHVDTPGAREILQKLLRPDEEQEIQLAAIRTIGTFDDFGLFEHVVQSWRSFSPAVRSEAGEMLLASKDRVAVLLEAMKNGDVAPAHIDPATRRRLLTYSDRTLQENARTLFEAPGDSSPDEAPGDSSPDEAPGGSSRAEILAKYRAAASASGNSHRGRKIFEQNCMSCHRFGARGQEVGPDLESVRHKTRQEILAQILDPNREVSPEFLLYDIQLKNSRSASGMIVNETSSSLTIKRPGGVEETILRQNIEQIRSSGMSIMPEGLETAITPQEMADLLEFLTVSTP
ncbi:MAG: c-type cytochrome [Luteitalea sp.]|nr:c-type cytochrome [Luteitalea sp.]